MLTTDKISCYEVLSIFQLCRAVVGNARIELREECNFMVAQADAIVPKATSFKNISIGQRDKSIEYKRTDHIQQLGPPC